MVGQDFHTHDYITALGKIYELWYAMVVRSVQRRGVLFILSLIVVALVFLLATTFVSVNRTQMAMSRDASARQIARLAAVSGQDYARMRLEADPSWGLPSGSNSAFTRVTDVNGLTVWEGETDSTISVVGIVGDNDAAFALYLQAPGQDLRAYQAVDLNSVLESHSDPQSWRPMAGETTRLSINNLSAVGGVLSPPQVGFRSLPARACNLQVRGAGRGTGAWVDATHRRTGALDIGAASGQDLAVSVNPGGQWVIDSTDPYGNQVSANRSLVTPPANQLQFGDGTNPSEGSAFSHQNINLGGSFSTAVDPLTGEVTLNGVTGGTVIGDGVNDQQERDQASATTGGLFSPNQPQKEAPEITVNDLKLPTGSTFSLAGGHYHFVGPDEVHFWFNPLTDPVTAGAPDQVFTGSIPDASGNPAVFLQDRKFIVSDNTRVDINGDARLSSNQDGLPYLSIGFGADGSPADQNSLGALTVAGDFNLEGAVVGSGSLVTTAANGSSGRLTLQGKSALSAPADAGVAVYAEGPVRMRPVDPRADVTNQVDLSALNWSAYQWGLANTPNINYDDWLSLSPGQRETRVDVAGDGLEEKDVPQQFYDDLLASFPNIDPSAAQIANDWWSQRPPQFENWVGIREYLKAVTNGESPQAAADYWLQDPNGANNDTVTIPVVASELTAFAQAGAPDDLRTYLSQPYAGTQAQNQANNQPGVNARDADFRGVIYTASDFFGEMDGFEFSVDGSIVARGDLILSDAGQVTTRFNPQFVDQLLEQPVALGGGQLEVVVWIEN